MSWLKRIYVSLLIMSVILLSVGQSVFAQESEEPLYTYTVRLSAGRMGKLTSSGYDIKGIQVVRYEIKDGGIIRETRDPSDVDSQVIGDQVVISGLKYSIADSGSGGISVVDSVTISPSKAAEVTDDKYYIRGVRRSGRDKADELRESDSGSSPSSGFVTRDMDYVIAYGVRGTMVEYTVNYLDESGNPLMDSEYYYGNPGEMQYVSANYIEGYLPQTYNQSKTLDPDSENIFNFVYTPIAAGETTVTEGGDTTTTGAGATGAGAAGAGAGAAGAGAGAAGADAGAAGADAGVGGDVAAVPDEGVPLDDGPEDLQNLDDEDVPLANVNQERPGKVVSYLPVYIGIGAAAAIALAATAIYLRKRRRVPAKEIVEKIRNDEIK